jgi:hypothetical protein
MDPRFRTSQPIVNGHLAQVTNVNGFPYLFALYPTIGVGKRGKIRIAVAVVLDLNAEMFDGAIDLSL